MVMLCPFLMYADDIALLAPSANQLQVLITDTYIFCNTVGLSISPSKSNIVVFSKQAISVPAFTCIDTTIPEATSAKYIGLIFHQRHGLFTYEPLLNEMVAAWAVLRCQYADLSVQFQCFTRHVSHQWFHTVAKYGAQLTIPAAMK